MPKSIDLKATRLFKETLESSKKIIVHSGGSRSGKTVAICQYLIMQAIQNPKFVITIVRKTLPSIKATVFRDFKEILTQIGIFNEDKFNKSEMIYTFDNDTIIEFISIDQPQKIRGRKRNLLYINESNELSIEDWTQLSIRTEGKIILDLNPSDADSYVYDVQSRDDCQTINSSYKDNPFLSDSLIQEIERLQNTDSNLWNIYGLGIRGTNSDQIITHSKIGISPSQNVAYGIDIGYNHKAAIVKVQEENGSLYWTELLYQSGLTHSDIIERVKSLGIKLSDQIFVDSAVPAIIDELKRNGFYNAGSSNKSVQEGLNFIKSKPLYIHPDSSGLFEEIRKYKWKKDSKGKLTDVPVKLYDDLIDAGRYASLTGFKTTQEKYSVFTISL